MAQQVGAGGNVSAAIVALSEMRKPCQADQTAYILFASFREEGFLLLLVGFYLLLFKRVSE